MAQVPSVCSQNFFVEQNQQLGRLARAMWRVLKSRVSFLNSSLRL